MMDVFTPHIRFWRWSSFGISQSISKAQRKEMNHVAAVSPAGFSLFIRRNASAGSYISRKWVAFYGFYLHVANGIRTCCKSTLQHLHHSTFMPFILQVYHGRKTQSMRSAKQPCVEQTSIPKSASTSSFPQTCPLQHLSSQHQHRVQ